MKDRLTVFHCFPVNDLRPHDTDGEECWCRPRLVDGVLVHNSMDHREEYETGKLKPH